MTVDELAKVIEAQRKQRNMSMADVNHAAFGGGNNTAVQNIKRGIPPNFKTLNGLCEALGLDFYIGPHREPPPSLTGRERSDFADEFARIPLHNALLAAGAGANNHTEEIIEHLAFRTDWLHRIGTRAADARLARVQGDSMSPTLFAGDMVMIDTARTSIPSHQRNATDRRRSAVYALIDNGEARIKRIERPAEDVMILVSDNPDHPPEYRSGKVDLAAIQIIGKVIWWGHTER